MADCILFKSGDLLPEAWKHLPAEGPVWTFNPSLLRDGVGWIFAYRVIGADNLRRIGVCRLNSRFEVVAGSAVPLTDHVRFSPGGSRHGRAVTWFADPRLLRLGGRIYLYWNSGWHDPVNHQFIQQIDATTLNPVGYPRELLLDGDRRPLEKNWTIFGDGPFYAVYSINPHRILNVPLDGSESIECTEAASTPWKDEVYAEQFGELRGGTVPQRVDDAYVSIGHSIYGGHGEYRYVAAAYRFSATFPFAPVSIPVRPLALPNPFGGRRILAKLNPAVGEVIYPCGLALQDGRWIVSYGINDEHCAVAELSDQELRGALCPAG